MAEKHSRPDKVSAIALDYDFIQGLRNGASLYLRTARIPKFHVGDIIGIKETWNLGSEPGAYVYRADRPRDDCGMWQYSNTMPEDAVRQYVRVRNMKTAEYTDYLKHIGGPEIMYNGRYFYMDGCPDGRWFRDGVDPVDPMVTQVWITELVYEKTEG